MLSFLKLLIWDSVVSSLPSVALHAVYACLADSSAICVIMFLGVPCSALGSPLFSLSPSPWEIVPTPMASAAIYVLMTLVSIPQLCCRLQTWPETFAAPLVKRWSWFPQPLNLAALGTCCGEKNAREWCCGFAHMHSLSWDHSACCPVNKPGFTHWWDTPVSLPDCEPAAKHVDEALWKEPVPGQFISGLRYTDELSPDDRTTQLTWSYGQ